MERDEKGGPRGAPLGPSPGFAVCEGSGLEQVTGVSEPWCQVGEVG